MAGGLLSIVMPFRSGRELAAALAALLALDLEQMRWRRLPPLYSSGVRYRRETCLAPHIRETCERWLTAEQLLKERFGDCEDLAAYRAAELRHSGEDPHATPIAQRTRAGWHIVVRRGNGNIEDPSVVLGMRSQMRRKKGEVA